MFQTLRPGENFEKNNIGKKYSDSTFDILNVFSIIIQKLLTVQNFSEHALEKRNFEIIPKKDNGQVIFLKPAKYIKYNIT